MSPVAVLNSTAEPIPPGAAMEPVGTADVNGRIRVRKPTANDSLAVLVNAGTPIPAGQSGVGYLPWFGPLAAAVDSSLISTVTGDWSAGASSGPAVVGVKAGSWYLHAGRVGFRVQAGPLGGLVPVQAEPQSASDGPRAYMLDVPCLVTNGSGAVVGLAGVVVDGTGASAECVVKGLCEGDCGESSVPPPPPPPVTATISGTVARTGDAAGPVVGRSVVLLGAGTTVTTDGSGNYSFTGVSGPSLRFVQLALEAGETATNSVDGGGSVAGRVATVYVTTTSHDADFTIATSGPSPEPGGAE